MYRIELHLHTKYSSGCGQMDEFQLLDAYSRGGYDALVVTDHYNRDTFRHLHMDLKGSGDFLGKYLEGVRRVQEEGARRGIRVYRGAEVRFDGSQNDYLLFGYSDALLADPNRVFTMGLEAFSRLVRAEGAVLIQAHPFRWMCTPADHRWLDGVEIRNMHPGHKSHNEKAEAYAARWPGMILTSGSDCHEPHHACRGGIVSSTLPEDEKALVALLRSGEYTLLG